VHAHSRLENRPVVAADADPDPMPRLRPWLLVALSVAVISRGAWLWTKPLWRDEAWVARLAGQSFDRALGDPHAVPLGFLALVKLSGALPGLPPEVGLRLVPLIAGLAALPVLAALARRLGASPWTTLSAVWLATGLPALIYYSRELKPYSLDLLLAVLVPWLALETLEPRPGTRPVRRGATALALVACALATPWISFGANFVVGPTLAWAALPTGRRKALPWMAALAFAVSFAAAYSTALGPQSDSLRLRDTWREELAVETAQPGPSQAAAALWRYFAVSLPYLFPGVWPLVVVLAIVGLWAWPRRERWLISGWCLGPAVATTVAVVTGRYVIGHGRLLLFAAPPLILLAAAGLVRLAEAGAALAGRAGGERLGAALAAAACVVWSTQSMLHRVRPYRTDVARYFLFDILQDVDPIIAEAERRVAPGEPLMVSRYAGEAFLFYAHGRLPSALVCTRRNCRDDGPVLQNWLQGIRERGWMIVLEEEKRSGRRNTARLQGLQVRTAARARGVRLWEIRRPHTP
jgi:hypothetical protein